MFPPQGTVGVGAIPSNTVVTETTYGQASTAGVGGTSSRGDHTHGTPVVPALDDLSDVTIAAPAVDEILRYNGAGWVNGTSVTVGAGPGVIFYLDSTKVIPAGVGPQTKSMETLLKVPSSAAEVDETEVVNNNTAIIDQYMYNTALGITSIDAGEWTFDTYTYVSDASGTSEVITSVGRVFIGAGTISITGAGTTRTATVVGGTPFLASDFNADITQTGKILTPNAVLVISGFTSTSVVTVTCLATYTNEAGVAYSVDRYMFQSTTGEINELAPTLKMHTIIQPAFATNLTDKLVVIYYAKTDNVGNVTVHLLHNGTEHYTRVHTPLSTKHNDLAGLQGGVANQFYHLTQAEYTGTGTGNFVRETGPTIATPSMTNVSITSGSITGTDVTATDLKSATTTIAIDAAVAPTAGQVLTATSGTAANWQTVAAGMVSDAIRNTKGGTDALRDNLVGTDNTAIGYNALLLDTASSNTAFGSLTLDAVTTGKQNTAIGKGAGSAIATTDDSTMVGYQAGLVNTAANNTFIGSGAGDANITGARNTALGKDASGANTAGADNICIGYQAGLTCTAGSQNVFIGVTSGANTYSDGNVIIGYNAGSGGVNITGNSSTFVGNRAGLANTSGADNTFIGSLCGDANTSGTRNTAVGKDALGANTTSSDCTMIGYQAGLLSTGASNTFVGSSAGDANTTGSTNTAVGYNALSAIVTGFGCVAIGYQAGLVNTSSQNTFIGSDAGKANIDGSYNTFMGQNTGLQNDSGNYNTFIGQAAGARNTSGSKNTCIGLEAGAFIVTNSDFTCLGFQAGTANEAANSTFIGSLCGDANTSGARNTALGKDALGANTTSSDVTCLGYQAGLVSTGASNTFLGSSSGNTNTTGINNVFIGDTAVGSAAARSNAIAIGHLASVTADSTWVIGTIGIKQAIVEGANAAMGVATLVGGTILVANTLVTANSRIFLTSQDPNAGTQGAVFVSARVAATSFTITSTIGALDTAIVAWELKEPN